MEHELPDRDDIAQPTDLASRDFEAFYFGEDDRRLFGIYHVANAAVRRATSLVLCGPFGQESIRAHRSLRQLAVRASRQGFPVLRFDYHGCGDSMGRRDEGSIRQGLNDVSTSVAEIRWRTQSPRVCLVGLRLGAWLALRTAIRHDDVAGLVMWDPVHDGSVYLNELARAREQQRVEPGTPRTGPGELTEVLGFPVPAGLSAEFRDISLSRIERCPAPRVLVIDSGTPGGSDPVVRALSGLGARVDARHVPGAPTWAYHPAAPMTNPALLQSIAAWAGEWLP
jgi:pimeloyl-ACP methyl ester carboxylesterase